MQKPTVSPFDEVYGNDEVLSQVLNDDIASSEILVT